VTLVREYRLPHCTLILQEFATQAGRTLAVLIQVECYGSLVSHSKAWLRWKLVQEFVRQKIINKISEVNEIPAKI